MDVESASAVRQGDRSAWTTTVIARYNQLADGEPHKLCGSGFKSLVRYQTTDQ